MRFHRSASLLPAVLLLVACGHSRPTIPGFDTAAWRQDAYACRDQRAAQLPKILEAKEQLYGTRTAALEELLGRPDEEELAEQTEKTYLYYVQPGPQCAPGHPRSAVNKLSIHFGSLGTITEIRTEMPMAQ